MDEEETEYLLHGWEAIAHLPNNFVMLGANSWKGACGGVKCLTREVPTSRDFTGK